MLGLLSRQRRQLQPGGPWALAAEPDADCRRFTAVVLTRADAALDMSRVLARARSLWPAMPEVETRREDDGRLLVSIAADGLHGTIDLVPHPYCSTDLRGAADEAMGWPTAGADIEAHAGHAVVTVSHRNPFLAHMLLSHLAAAVLDQVRGCGVFWPSTGALISAAEFAGQCSKTRSGGIPTLLWARVAVADGRSRDGHPGLVVSTRGLEAFGFCELECVCSREELHVVFGFMHGAAASAIQHAEPPPLGRTFAIEDRGIQAVSLYEARSLRVPGSDVLRLALHA